MTKSHIFATLSWLLRVAYAGPGRGSVNVDAYGLSTHIYSTYSYGTPHLPPQPTPIHPFRF